MEMLALSSLAPPQPTCGGCVSDTVARTSGGGDKPNLEASPLTWTETPR